MIEFQGVYYENRNLLNPAMETNCCTSMVNEKDKQQKDNKTNE